MSIALRSFTGATLALLTACAQLHHVQLSDISDLSDRDRASAKSIDIKVSETGVNLQEATDIAKAFTRNERTRDQMQQVQNMIALFQTGPRTGNPVYVENYWRDLPKMLAAECPGGRIANLMSLRETRKYPVISGEIVRIKATCLTRAR
jgi:hypothetical protein